MTTAELQRNRFTIVNNAVKEVSGGTLFAEPSKLRIEVSLLKGVGRYLFDIKKDGILNAYEKSLNRNDVFVPSGIGLFVAIQSNENPSTEVLYPYIPVNDGENPSIHSVGFLNGDANAIYNGTLEWLIQNGVLLSSFPTERFKKVPQTQGLFALNSADAAVNEGVQSQWSIEEAIDTVIPQLVVAGTQDHRITVNFNAEGLDFAVTEGHTPKLVLYMDGFLVKGGCQYIDGKNAFAGAVGQW